MVDEGAFFGGRAAGEEVAHAQLDGPQLEDAASRRGDVESTTDPLERCEAPDVAERQAVAAVGQRPLTNDDAGRRTVVGAEPGERQALAVPDLDRQRRLVAPRDAVRAEPAAVLHAGQATA